MPAEARGYIKSNTQPSESRRRLSVALLAALHRGVPRMIKELVAVTEFQLHSSHFDRIPVPEEGISAYGNAIDC